MIFSKFFYTANLITLLICSSNFCHAKRVALVIGNSDYISSPLVNPINDARDFESKLRRLGFNENIVKVENLKKSNIGKTIREFTSKIQEGDEVVFFYAGHGIQLKGVNYLPAVDADIQSEDDVALNSINVAQLLDRLEEAKSGVKLIFLDACRNNPFARGFRSSERGLNRMGDAPSGTLISFATRPGSVAADGIGRNGLYTSHLLKYIDTPGITIESLLKKVSSSVSVETNKKQEPWIEGSISGEFYFQAEITPVTSKNTENISPINLDNEKSLWKNIKDSLTAEPFFEYMKIYPNGIYFLMAQESINKIQKKNRLEEEDVLWAKATEKSGIISYLSQFPDGRHVSSAKGRLLDFEKIELDVERKKNQQKSQVTIIPSIM